LVHVHTTGPCQFNGDLRLTQEATAVGYKEIEDRQVWFIGMNLAFHILLTKDPVGFSLLEEVLHLEAGAVPIREAVPMAEYTAGSDGYSFDYSLDEDRVLMIPIARHDGTTVTIDSSSVSPMRFGDMTYINAPEGRHTVRLGFEPTAVYRFGFAATSVAALIIIGMVAGLPGSLRRVSLTVGIPRKYRSPKSWTAVIRMRRRREPLAGGDPR